MSGFKDVENWHPGCTLIPVGLFLAVIAAYAGAVIIPVALLSIGLVLFEYYSRERYRKEQLELKQRTVVDRILEGADIEDITPQLNPANLTIFRVRKEYQSLADFLQLHASDVVVAATTADINSRAFDLLQEAERAWKKSRQLNFAASHTTLSEEELRLLRQEIEACGDPRLASVLGAALTAKESEFETFGSSRRRLIISRQCSN